MKNNNILYIGIDNDNHIKIGMTQQTTRERQAGSDYLIWCYADAGNTMSRKQLLKCEKILRYVFQANYKQVTTDRFERADEEWLHWFIRVINCINKYSDTKFATPQSQFNLRPDVVEEYFEYKKKIQFYLENPITDNLFEGIL